MNPDIAASSFASGVPAAVRSSGLMAGLIVGIVRPLLRLPGWQLLALGLVTACVGVLAGSRTRPRRGKPLAPELNRWENEGGMAATRPPVAAAAVDQPVSARADGHDPASPFRSSLD